MTALRAVFALALLAAAMPPGWFPGAGLLVFPGLALVYALVTSDRVRRPVLLCAVLGGLHFFVFSWSTRHVLFLAPLLIGSFAMALWGLLAAWTRALRGLLPGAFAFGLAVAGECWVRSNWPEIAYPHAQPAHALYHWPWLLGPVAWVGGEFANFMVAGLAAACVDLYRSWRLAAPPWRGTRNALLALSGLWIFCVLVPAPRHDGQGPEVTVVAVQPNLPAGFKLERDYGKWFARRLLEPTARYGGSEAPMRPDLVLWPESTYPLQVRMLDGPPRMDARPLGLAAGTRLVAGSELTGRRHTPAAVLLDADGKLLGWQEKIKLVPAGEYLPFWSLLPGFAERWLQDQIIGTMGFMPDMQPGEYGSLLHTAPPAEVPFAALLCYDNAFPDVARHYVRQGARFLVVLSNEAWYHAGAELDQMEAMSVFRALETGTPIVRCTLNGLSLQVDARGRVRGRQPRGLGAAAEPPRILLARVRPGPGALPPLAWLRNLWLALVGLSSLALLRQVARSWARLLRGRSPVSHASPSADPGDDPSWGGP